MFVTALSITCIQQCCEVHRFIRSSQSHHSNPTSTSAENRFNTRPVGFVSLMQQQPVIEKYLCCKKKWEKLKKCFSKSHVFVWNYLCWMYSTSFTTGRPPSAEFWHPPLEGFVKCTIQGICLVADISGIKFQAIALLILRIERNSHVTMLMWYDVVNHPRHQRKTECRYVSSLSTRDMRKSSHPKSPMTPRGKDFLRSTSIAMTWHCCCSPTNATPEN